MRFINFHLTTNCCPHYGKPAPVPVTARSKARVALYRDHRFETRPRHRCVHAFLFVVLFCVVAGLAHGRFPAPNSRKSKRDSKFQNLTVNRDGPEGLKGIHIFSF